MSDSDSSSTNHHKHVRISTTLDSSKPLYIPWDTLPIRPVHSRQDPITITPVSPSQLVDYIDAPATLIIDVRSYVAYSTARVVNALPLSTAPRITASMHTSSPSCILIYDANSSSLPATSAIHDLARELIAAGFTGELAWLEGGFQAVWLHRRDLLNVSPLVPERDLEYSERYDTAGSFERTLRTKNILPSTISSVHSGHLPDVGKQRPSLNVKPPAPERNLEHDIGYGSAGGSERVQRAKSILPHASVHSSYPPDTGEQSISLYNYTSNLADDFVLKLPYKRLPAPKVHSSLLLKADARTVQCKTANAAYNHAVGVEHTISDALAKSGLDGLYLIQAGFNEELVSSGMGTLEEIYIFLNCEFPANDSDLTAIFNRLKKILAPFPGIVYTPQNTHYILPEGDPSRYLELAKDAMVYTQGLEFAKKHAGGSNVGSSSSSIQGIWSGNSGGLDPSGSESGSGGGQRDVDRGGNERGGGSDNDDDDNNESSNNDSSDSRRPKHQEPKNLSIPFLSKITIKDDKKESLSMFTVSAVADIELVESPRSMGLSQKHTSTSYPNNWYGPWFSVQIPSVVINFSNIDASREGPYRPSVTQMRIIASSCPCSFLSFSPQDASSIDDAVKVKSERNTTGGAWATLSGLPGLKVGGSVSQVSGQETIERKWETVVLPCTGDGGEKWVTWRYILNERHPDASAPTGTFKPGPSVEFGYKLRGRKPQLEVELVMCWSALNGSKGDRIFRFWEWFSGNRGKEDAKAPGGFANMLHQVSMCVDLERLTSTGWVVNLNTKEADEAKLSEIRGVGSSQFEPIKVKVDSEDERLECEVVLRRALHGRIQLLREDRMSDQPFLPSLSQSNTSSGYIPRSDDVALVTPPPSPLPLLEGSSGYGMISSKAKGKQREM